MQDIKKAFNRTSVFVALMTSLVALSITAVVTPQRTDAQVSQLVYGGYIFSLPCYCNPSAAWVFLINPTVGGVFDYIYGSQGYLNYMLPENLTGLGLYQSVVGECLWYFGVTCSPMPSMGTIDFTTGTSE